MDNQEPPRRTSRNTWLLLAGVFAAAVVVTLIVGTRGGSDEPDFPDLGDIASQDPNLPGDAEPAPNFALTTFAGDTFDLSEHVANDGRPVILNLWASWCGPCRAEMPAIDTSASQHPEVAYIGVAVMDNENDARAFAEEIGVTYPLAHDDGSVEDAYPVLGLPATIYINGDGTIAKTHFGVVTVESLDEEIAELFGS
ncbi:MAG: TlpA disulfide reductase family protein [Acidimicrobiia bacterium]|nr:TlpA disulfide reductase family protein [Acidimicrobiia bacterium]